MLWKVLIHMVRATGPTRPSMRSFISPAALLVKVMATISCGCTLVRLDEVGDAVGEHAGLARAGAGEDEQRALEVGDGLALGLVEAGEQRVLRRAGAPGPRRPAALLAPLTPTQLEQQAERSARRRRATSWSAGEPQPLARHGAEEDAEQEELDAGRRRPPSR